MKSISLALIAALALCVNACEQHSREETEAALHSKHSPTAHEGAGHSRNSGEVHENATPHNPTAVPTNPAGAGPADTHDPALYKGAGGKEPGAVKYFPKQ